MRFRSKGFSLSFLAWEKSFFFAPFIPLSRGLWYTGAQGAGCKQAAGNGARRGQMAHLMNGDGTPDACNGRRGSGVGLAG